MSYLQLHDLKIFRPLRKLSRADRRSDHQSAEITKRKNSKNITSNQQATAKPSVRRCHSRTNDVCCYLLTFDLFRLTFIVKILCTRLHSLLESRIPVSSYKPEVLYLLRAI